MPPPPIDRTVVESFFTWSSKGWELMIASGLFLCCIGGYVAWHEYVKVGLWIILVGLVVVWAGRYRKNKLKKLYAVFKRARNEDLKRVLLRSYTKTSMDVRSFLDLPSRSVVQLDLSNCLPAERDMLEILMSKASFWMGQQNDEGRARFTNGGKYPLVEFSPILVTILYFTRTEMIVYTANIDVTKGDLLVEQLNRLLLKDIADITTNASTERFARAGNAALFMKYEKAMKVTLEADIMRVKQAIQVTKRNGQIVQFAASAPQYRDGEHNILDHDPYASDQFAVVARQISQAIQEAS